MARLREKYGIVRGGERYGPRQPVITRAEDATASVLRRSFSTAKDAKMAQSTQREPGSLRVLCVASFAIFAVKRFFRSRPTIIAASSMASPTHHPPDSRTRAVHNSSRNSTGSGSA